MKHVFLAACSVLLLGFRNGCRAFIDLSKKSPGEFEIDCVCDGGRLTVNRSGIHLTREEHGVGLKTTDFPANAADDDLLEESSMAEVRRLSAPGRSRRSMRSSKPACSPAPPPPSSPSSH